MLALGPDLLEGLARELLRGSRLLLFSLAPSLVVSGFHGLAVERFDARKNPHVVEVRVQSPVIHVSIRRGPVSPVVCVGVGLLALGAADCVSDNRPGASLPPFSRRYLVSSGRLMAI